MADKQTDRHTDKQADKQADWSLVKKVKAGDDRAFDALMEHYKLPILNFIYRIIGDASEAEDVAQEVFVRAYQHIQKPGVRRTTGAFSTWLFQIGHNAALDFLRWQRRHPAEPLTSLEEDGEPPAAACRNAAEEAAAKETGEQIAAAVALLPEDQRTAFVLSEYEALPNAEIAAIMQCSRKSVEARLSRARQFLRQRLAHLLE